MTRPGEAAVRLLHRWRWPAVVIVLGVAGASILAAWQAGRSAPGVDGSRPPFSSNDPIERACSLEDRILLRIYRGNDPVRSEDVTIVPRAPNFVGTFELTSHSGPWDYLQEVPLALYGPGRIAASGSALQRDVSITDVYASVGELLGVDLPRREGEALHEALLQRAGAPRLIVFVVWDGAGRNTLEEWPDAWPNLSRMEREGTSYAEATVGSSPSITSVTHSSLGTGVFPRSHGVTGNEIRGVGGKLVPTFSGRRADELEATTFADEVDLALGNEPRVGLLGWKQWHLGMMGHGASIAGADRDELALIGYPNGIRVSGNPELYRTPSGLEDSSSIDARVDALDRADGRSDGKWLGHDVSLSDESTWTTYSNPAWVEFEADLALEMLAEGAYGRDATPDLFFVNFKMTDLAGHQWGINSRETAAVLRAQDEALGRIVTYLDDQVRDYVIVVTSDHGHTPTPAATGAWPISQTELIDDIDAHFEVSGGRSLIESSAAFGLYLDARVMKDVNVTADEVARFINSYRVRDNWSGDQLPGPYEDRGDEHVFSAAFPSDRLDEVLTCAFGSSRPPDTRR
jgi:hypothetical protein